jgi:hypothetical protein
VALGAVLGGCATAAQRTPTTAGDVVPRPWGTPSAPALTQLCALDALLWSHGFVPRVVDRDCVTILESVVIGP